MGPDIEKLCDLAKLELKDDEKSRLPEEMSKILEFFNQMNEVNTENIAPLRTPVEIEFQPSHDRVEAFENAPESLMENTPEKQGNLFKVPSVI